MIRSEANNMVVSMCVTVTQVEPAYLDLQISSKRGCNVIADTSENGANLVAYPDSALPSGWSSVWANSRRYHSETFPLHLLP